MEMPEGHAVSSMDGMRSREISAAGSALPLGAGGSAYAASVSPSKGGRQPPSEVAGAGNLGPDAADSAEAVVEGLQLHGVLPCRAGSWAWSTTSQSMRIS